MSAPRNGQDPVDALLREAHVDPAEAAALAALLSSVAPTDPHLPAGSPGEYAALAAFRSAHRETAIRPRGAFAMYRNRTRAALLTAKTAAAALVLVSAGGVAMAATTGAIPTPLTPSHPAHPAHPVHPVTPKVSDDANDSDATDSDANDDNGGLRDTCTQFTAGAFSDPTAAASSDAFRHLVIAAGGQDNVAAFCAALPAKDDEQGEDHGNSANAPGHDPNGPGNSENAPGHDPNGPGNSENAPGHNKGSGNSGHGNSANAPGHNKGTQVHGNSANAPGHNKGSDDKADDGDHSGHGNSGSDDQNDD